MCRGVFELSQLELLCAVERTGSYSAAARELKMTQPAVTYQMQRLERMLGTPITVRVGRSMRLTSVGKVVQGHAEHVLAEVRSAERQINMAVGAGTATVRLAAFPSSCATIVPAALAKLRRSHPNLTVRVEQGDVPLLDDLVSRGDVDIALTYTYAPKDRGQSGPKKVGRLYRVPVGIDDISLLLPAQHHAAAHSTVSVDELLSDTFLLGSQRFARLLTELAEPFGAAPPHMVLVADDYVTMQSFVAYGHGLTLVPDLALRAHRDERVVARSLRGWPARHVAVVMWPDQYRVPAVITVTEALRAAMRQEVSLPATAPSTWAHASGAPPTAR